MSRISEAFERARAERRAALVTYLCAGDPSLEATRVLVPTLFAAGADVVELGIPFSDPIADGPTIQAASFRALQSGTTVRKVLQVVRDLRAAGTTGPIVLMTYLNPLYALGLPAFFESAAAAGVDGVIIPDLPLEECEETAQLAAGAGVDLVLLVAPTTPPERLAQIGKRTRGFLYFVSVAGVTGARVELPSDLAQRLAQAREVSAAPVAVGFGIATPEQIRGLRTHADGVVVGSALVKLAHESGGDPARVEAFVRALRDATPHA